MLQSSRRSLAPRLPLGAGCCSSANFHRRRGWSPSSGSARRATTHLLEAALRGRAPWHVDLGERRGHSSRARRCRALQVGVLGALGATPRILQVANGLAAGIGVARAGGGTRMSGRVSLHCAPPELFERQIECLGDNSFERAKQVNIGHELLQNSVHFLPIASGDGREKRAS
jgi:hypothetical protein